MKSYAPLELRIRETEKCCNYETVFSSIDLGTQDHVVS